MNRRLTLLIGSLVLVAATVIVSTLRSAPADSFQAQEYAMIRWGGLENTQLIRPNGEVEMLKPLFPDVRALKKQGVRVDERALLMTIATNALAKEGYTVSAMTDNQILMSRAVSR